MDYSADMGRVLLAIGSAVIFAAITPLIWFLLFYAARFWPVSILWWLLLVGWSLGMVRGLFVVVGDLIASFAALRRGHEY